MSRYPFQSRTTGALFAGPKTTCDMTAATPSLLCCAGRRECILTARLCASPWSQGPDRAPPEARAPHRHRRYITHRRWRREPTMSTVQFGPFASFLYEDDDGDGVTFVDAKSAAVSLQCAVCRALMFAPATAPCGHSACAACFHEWAAQRGTCMVCRAPAPADALVRSLDLMRLCAAAMAASTESDDRVSEGSQHSADAIVREAMTAYETYERATTPHENGRREDTTRDGADLGRLNSVRRRLSFEEDPSASP